MSIQSQASLKRCMKFLQVDGAATQGTRVDAMIEIPKYNRRGPIAVEFHVSPGDGPFISVDPTIRGYGIRVDEFRPAQVRMRFDARSGTLRVSHEDDYDFVLQFAQEQGR
jgi:hypothetical protein